MAFGAHTTVENGHTLDVADAGGKGNHPGYRGSLAGGFVGAPCNLSFPGDPYNGPLWRITRKALPRPPRGCRRRWAQRSTSPGEDGYRITLGAYAAEDLRSTDSCASSPSYGAPRKTFGASFAAALVNRPPPDSCYTARFALARRLRDVFRPAVMLLFASRRLLRGTRTAEHPIAKVA
jgi:hypothetical protein